MTGLPPCYRSCQGLMETPVLTILHTSSQPVSRPVNTAQSTRPPTCSLMSSCFELARTSNYRRNLSLLVILLDDYSLLKPPLEQPLSTNLNHLSSQLLLSHSQLKSILLSCSQPKIIIPELSTIPMRRSIDSIEASKT